ncbi:transglutaminaseTgpA domain-containing protein [Marinactinospora thermotolerans]|uniref:Transglutaminase-like enzymes, putative cysteine proteases n=1 Tax=Marinactinospora thermotolerans DSM 45154 TaxID=1122192 RepID=A0A1T4KWE3_9ACTN|nr:transglutaminaseTgpA domain-containing protein [Marinactinospora thermotolerans]SJZ46772.1 Transglutaminase-like enzymes, putative cysteine proteases [Marinactinospora thermotolerans DSM 45154]
MKGRVTVAATLATLGALPLLHPLFLDRDWWPVPAVAVLAVGLTSLAARALRSPALLLPLFQAVVLLALLTGCHASGEALLGVVPTGGSMAVLRGLAEAGMAEIDANPSPIEATSSLVFVVTLSLGLFAMLVDLVVVTLRLAALSGLALLALLFVPLSVHEEGIGGPAFVVAAAGFLILLVVDGWERARERGALPGRAGGAGRHAVDGLLIAAPATALALLVPAVVPGLASGTVFGLIDEVRGDNGTVTTVHPMASLRRGLLSTLDRRVLEYRTSTEEPDYLRVHVLDAFDGENWTMSAVRAAQRYRVTEEALPPVPGVESDAAVETTTDITVTPTAQDMNFLPLPYPAQRIEISGDWFADPDTLMVFAPQGNAGGLTYRVTSPRFATDPDDLAAASPNVSGVDRRYLDVPAGLDPRIGELTRSIVADASGPHERAVALQEWFTDGRFEYSLQPPAVPEGEDPLARFLFEERVGYCEQFAAAMALMARQAGIPARVAVGYTPGEQIFDDHWLVTERDAHAWPELYFEGHGWLRFEPTPSSGQGQPGANVPDHASSAPEGGTPTPDAPEEAATGSTTDVPSPEEEPTPSSSGSGAPAAEAPTSAPTSRPAPLSPLVLVSLTLVVAPLLPALLRTLRRRVRWAGARSHAARSRAAWLELRDDVLDTGLAWNPAESPRGVARRLGEERRLSAEARAALDRIALAEEGARYAPVPPAPSQDLAADSLLLRGALRAGAGPWGRMRAVLLPRSLLVWGARPRRRRAHA